MTVEDLNMMVERLAELYKERREDEKCRLRRFDEMFGYLYWPGTTSLKNQVCYGSDFAQDEEIDQIEGNIIQGLEELGFSEAFCDSIDFERYARLFCNDYVPFNMDKYQS